VDRVDVEAEEHMQKTLVGALMLALALAPGAAFAKDGREKKNPFANIPVSGTVPNTTQTFAGTMDIIGFRQGTDATGAATVMAVGVLNGTLAGMPVTNQMISWPVKLPTAAASDPRSAAVGTQATCDILNLVLGPLHLDLLGLVVDLNQVVLNVTAQSGAGNLLGNLLCAVVNLLNGPAALFDAIANIATALNNLATLLNGLGL
jgi:hypothetical protein